MSKSILLVLFLLYKIKLSDSSVENHPFHLKELFEAELSLLPILVDLEKEFGDDLQSTHLSQYLANHEETVVAEMKANGIAKKFQGDNDGLGNFILERLVSNVIHIYSLMLRTHFFMENITSHLNLDPEKYNWYLEQFSRLRSEATWSTEMDFHDSILSLSRVQYVYQISAYDLANGKLANIHTHAKLRPEDCHIIADDKMDLRYPLLPTTKGPEFALAIEWLEAAMEINNDYGQNHSYNEMLKQELKEIKGLHDEHFQPIREGDGPSAYPNECFFLHKFENSSSKTAREMRILESEEFQSRYGGGYDFHSYSRRDFFALCRGERIKLRNEIDKETDLICKYDTKQNPSLTISPLKVEIVKKKPLEVRVIHDALTIRQINILKDLIISTKRLKTAKVFNISDPSKDFRSLDRIQSNGWLFEKDFPELIEISRRLDDVSGLHVSFQDPLESVVGFKESEDYQIGLYGPGGLYLCHQDALQEESIKWRGGTYVGDRIATAMLYLSEVEGGKTAFPNIGAAATPKLGSAVLWFNLDNSGRPDHNSLHGGCPVLYGIKWVSNKWIREGSQLFKRPCLR